MTPATLKRLYGLKPPQLAKMCAAQGNRCYLCRKPFHRDTRPPAVDHEHKTGLIRGLLCLPCNYELGVRHDNVEWFQRAAEYLTNTPALSVIGACYVPGSIGAADDSDA